MKIQLMKNGSKIRDQRSEIRDQKASFTLVEVSLALLVVAIGILATFGLFPAGLDQGMRSAAETHAAFFSEEVFAGMRANADEDFLKLTNPVPIAAADMWDAGSDLPDIEVTGTNIATNVYRYKDITHHAFRYRLNVTNITPDGTVVGAVLDVWSGEYGSIDNPVTFYTEFYRTSDF